MLHKPDSKHIKTKQKLFKLLKTKAKAIKKAGMDIVEKKISKFDSLVVRWLNYIFFNCFDSKFDLLFLYFSYYNSCTLVN